MIGNYKKALKWELYFTQLLPLLLARNLRESATDLF